jgi:hypothetical protein
MTTILRFLKKTAITGFLLLSLAATAQAPPPTATCPYDGEMAFFTEQVGTGSGRICWYAHDHLDRQTLKTIHHSFHNPCPE